MSATQPTEYADAADERGNAQGSVKGAAGFSPRGVATEHLIVSFLMQRISTLPKEAIADLASLAPELSECDSREVLDEIAETIREIIFPDLIGGVQRGKAGPISETGNLKKRMEFIGQQIKDRRKAAGLTQEGLAEKSGLPQSHISRLEAGQHSPSHKTVERIAAALDISVGDLDPASE